MLYFIERYFIKKQGIMQFLVLRHSLEKSSFFNIEQQSLEFVKYTIDHWVARWE